jgi:hypothetical protein
MLLLSFNVYVLRLNANFSDGFLRPELSRNAHKKSKPSWNEVLRMNDFREQQQLKKLSQRRGIGQMLISSWRK